MSLLTAKLFLTSAGLCTPELRTEFTKFVGRAPKDCTAVFVPTAADPETDRSWVDSARNELAQVTSKVIDLDLKSATPASLRDLFEKVQIVFVNGGNTFYLLHWARRSGFIDEVRRFVRNGGIYVGVSAGSILACPTIEAAGWKGFDDPKIVELENLDALNFVNFHTFVHYHPKWEDLIARELPGLKTELIRIADGEALSVDKNSVKRVGSPVSR